ncbi:fructose-bisphosphate aldolase, class II [Desulfovibrionales bacterium]
MFVSIPIPKEVLPIATSLFDRALAIGRPPNVVKLFPNSRALIVSGKAIDRAMLIKGRAMAIAANGRSHLVIRGVLAAAQRADAAVIIEIAKSEGGANAYCSTSLWNVARQVDALCNEMGITVPVAVHCDHYSINSSADLDKAKVEIPSLFDYGITSIAIDASHLTDDENLLVNIALKDYVPAWVGYETEVGEIKGKVGLSTPAEACYLIKGLNAHGIYADWIALNNGTTHGIEASDMGIQVELTASIHQALAPYKVSGAQHGISGNNYGRLRRIATESRTTKANVATALQMISWGIKVNEYGNVELSDQDEFIKISGQGLSDELWAEIRKYAAEHDIKGSNYKKVNLLFENKILGQSAVVRCRMVKAVEDFVFTLLVEIFNARDTAPLAIEAIVAAGSYDLGPKVDRIEDPAEWTEAKLRARATKLYRYKGPEGNFDD